MCIRDSNGPPASVNIIFYFFKKAEFYISGWRWVGGFFICGNSRPEHTILCLILPDDYDYFHYRFFRQLTDYYTEALTERDVVTSIGYSGCPLYKFCLLYTSRCV